MAKGITYEEWAKALEEASSKNDSVGFTVRELMDMFGKSDKAVRNLLGRLKDDGKLAVGRKQVSKLDGTTGYVPVYRIVAKKRSKRNA